MIYIDCEQEDALFSSRENKPPCCFSQSQGIQIIGVISCVSGLFITCLTLAYGQQSSDLVNKLENGFDPIPYLLFIGMSSALSSICLLCKEGSRMAVKIWTGVHFLCTIISIIMFSNMLTETESNFDRLMQVILSFTGLNLCIVIFNMLNMVEFLLHPADSKESRS